MRKGFTLIELLVVITLIGILAVAVLSALNPIEQINKAGDARRRADAAQLIQALDRYFASNEQFPWNSATFVGQGQVLSVDGVFKQTGSIIGVGVCGGTNATNDGADTNGCTTPGLLVSTQELKTQFTKRPYFKTSPTLSETFYVVKELNDPSVSVCFVPTAKATRNQLAKLRHVSLTATPAITTCATAPTNWTTAATACFWCIPED